ncbi:MAG: histidine ammonia-lyase [Acidimicrobiia bacterium]|nr:histidine ammonia-lyase [Acidimicrobiia bacterium]
MIHLDGTSLTLDALSSIALGHAPVALSPDAVARVQASRAVVDRHAALPHAVYGINTGFGALAEVPIPQDQLAALQLNLLRSHAAGVGDPLTIPETRAVMALRANVLAKGCSGIRLETLEALLALLNAGVTPHVPSRGSVGASGDLAPLAHLALVLVGEGACRAAGGPEPGRAALSRAGLTPVTLAPKEGLALINGTQASTGVLALAVLSAARLARAADIAAALSIDALRGSAHPFDARIHAARPVPGQAASAQNLRRLLDGSAINASHATCGKVQDAYALRCAPQVHGSAREAIGFAHRLADIEANSATDNPMVFADEDEIISGGNFHGASIALAADTLTIGLAQLATISERRTDRMMTPHESGLPAFLTRDSGLNSGFMMAHVTAAALTAEIKTLAHPAAVDTIPTSAGREDHVSMSMGASLKAARVLELAAQVIAIELMVAAQAIDLLAPLATSPALAAIHRAIRAEVPMLGDDRPPSPDITILASMVITGALERACPMQLT